MTESYPAVPRRQRDVLTANRTYYVRTDGSDSNDGLANTSGGAFLTIQGALNRIAATIDFAGYVVTVQVGTGTYTSTVTVPIMVGQKTENDLVIMGDTGTPANVIISTTSATAVACVPNAMATLQGFELRTTTSGNCISVDGTGAVLKVASLRYGACAGAHNFVQQGMLRIDGSATAIVGSAELHWWARNGGALDADFSTVTLTGTPAFSYTFALCQQGTVLAFTTFSGSATGSRYNVTLNGVINTNGGGASKLPGDVAGTSATGGQYN